MATEEQRAISTQELFGDQAQPQPDAQPAPTTTPDVQLDPEDQELGITSQDLGVAPVSRPKVPVATENIWSPQSLWRGVTQGFSELVSGAYEATGTAFDALDGLATWMAEQTGTQKGGLFRRIADDQFMRADAATASGIDETHGKSYAVAKHIYRGLGQASVDIPLIMATTLPGFSALQSAGQVALTEEGNVPAAAAMGAVQGAMMGEILKGLQVFQPVARQIGGASVFGGLTLAEELQKPEGERDYDRVVADFVIGAGLALNARPGQSTGQIIADARRQFGPTKFDKAVAELRRARRVLDDARLEQVRSAVRGKFEPVTGADTRVGDVQAQVFQPLGSSFLATKHKSYLDAPARIDPFEVAREVSRLRNEDFDKLPPAHRRNRINAVNEIINGTRKAPPEYMNAIDAIMNPSIPNRLPSQDPETVVVRRRGSEGYKQPPVTLDDYNTIQGLKPLPKIMLRSNDPSRMFEMIGGKKYYNEMIDAEHGSAEYHRLIKTQERTAIKENRETLRFGWEDRVGAYAVAQREGGRGVLERMGRRMKLRVVDEQTGKRIVKRKAVPEWNDLTPGEQNMYRFYRAKYEELYNRLNDSRVRSGKAPFPHVEDYFTFSRIIADLEAHDINPVNARIDAIQKFIHPKATPFPFAKEAKGAADLDIHAGRIFDRYIAYATDHIYKSPVIAKQRELLKPFRNSRGEIAFDLADEAHGGNPRIYKEWSEWLDFNSGKKVVSPFGARVDRALNRMNRNLAFAVMSGYIRSAIIQPSALVGAYSQVGERHFFGGLRDMLSTERRYAAMDKSRVLNARAYDINVKDALNSMPSAKLKGRRTRAKAAVVTGLRIGAEARNRAAKAGLEPLRILDQQTAVAVWNMGYRKATKELGMSPDGMNAIRYADDLVIRTQASATRANLTPIQRHALGKTVTAFQTFVLNDWSRLQYDMLGIQNPNVSTRQALVNSARWLTGMTIANIIYEDILGMRSPFPTPIRAFQEAEDRGMSQLDKYKFALLEMAEPVPIIGGSMRYGTSPFGAVTQLGFETAQVISGAPMAPDVLPLAGKYLGLPGTQQLIKIQRQRKAAAEQGVGLRYDNLQRESTRGGLSRKPLKR